MRAEIPNIFYDKSSVYQIGDHAIKVAVSGIGQKRARNTTKKVCTGFQGFYPDFLIALGFCGATRHDLDIGHLIIANRLSYRDQEIELQNVNLDKVINPLVGTEYRIGKLQTFNWPVFSRKRVSNDTFAVDMESFAIAETSRKYQVPAMIIKAVSDIVPEHRSLHSLLSFVRTIGGNTKTAKIKLNEFVKKTFLCDQWFDSDYFRDKNSG
jgi:nucleoside phosphorylase